MKASQGNITVDEYTNLSLPIQENVGKVAKFYSQNVLLMQLGLNDTKKTMTGTLFKRSYDNNS